MAPAVCFVGLMLVLTIATAEILDIRNDVAFIIRSHNNERKDNSLRAADMNEMVWDRRLVLEAESFVSKCEYKRPRMENMSSNIFFESSYMYGKRSIRRYVKSAVKKWSRSKSKFQYQKGCGNFCSYFSMINSKSDRIGCAANTCPTIDLGRRTEGHSTMMVCLYSPGADMYGSFPFEQGSSCSKCSSGKTCKKGLCGNRGEKPVPNQFLNLDEVVSNNTEMKNEMTRSEEYYVSRLLNNWRNSSGVGKLDWDDYLKNWASYVISCLYDYPGPRQSYSNFMRINQGQLIARSLYTWRSEGDNTNLKFEHGCRTKLDAKKCNHMTNVLEPMVDSLGCATKDCGDGTRHLVCLFDNKSDRPAGPYNVGGSQSSSSSGSSSSSAANPRLETEIKISRTPSRPRPVQPSQRTRPQQPERPQTRRRYRPQTPGRQQTPTRTRPQQPRRPNRPTRPVNRPNPSRSRPQSRQWLGRQPTGRRRQKPRRNKRKQADEN